ncbi:ubiquitin-protein ligase E3C [Belonocnema kinseyi]|uniref:ubiquitin-protein ligase E3C n=1 Tax=Belonocnema kinseyi TaxID=2817044 RepID=UPI00143E0BE3|nr:ubiquitin-protein ligase E3C [Belonocnema kinseyi]
MYNFEGDYKRKPQQNLAGASRRGEKAALLQHAQLERLKREQQRRKHEAVVKIQAYGRSFVARQLMKKWQRYEFDKMQQALGNKHLSVEELVLYLRRLLFFYHRTEDAGRLVWILQQFLKLQQEIKNKTNSSTEWLWRVRWVLKLCVEFIVDSISPDRGQSIAMPLRVLEIFTLVENDESTRQHLEAIFAYLLKNNYYEQMKKLVDSKIPPIDIPSAVPPTPMAKWIFDMIQRPLSIVYHSSHLNEFAFVAMRELCVSILSQKITEPVTGFVFPGLMESKEFPFDKLITCIQLLNIPPSLNLLYSILSLEPSGFAPGKTNEFLISYLEVLASMSSTINPPPSSQTLETDESDSDTESMILDNSEAETQQKCVNILNDEQRVQAILGAVENCNDPGVMQPLCQLCHNLLITHKLAIHKYKLLYMLAFKPVFLRELWNTLLSLNQISPFGGSTPLLHILSRGIALSPDDAKKIIPLLAVFCSLFSLLIATLHDTEFFVDGSETMSNNHGQQAMPFTTSDLVPLSNHLKGICLGLVELAFPDTRPSVRDDYKSVVLGLSPSSPSEQNTHVWTHLFKVTVGLIRQLHTRDLRRQFCPDGHWIASNIVIPIDKPQDFTLRRRRLRSYVPFQGLRVFTREDVEEGPPMSTKEVRTLTLLREIPFVVPFSDRVIVLQSLIYRDKLDQQGELTHFMQGPSIQISVRRNYLYEDAFDKLSPENEPEMRLKMRVQLVNTAGLEEAGVDGGGLFREFLTELLRTSFDPNRGFFRLTKDNLLYPNPTVHLLVEDYPKHYYFIGRILGKGLYENLLVELPFAEFFLSKIVGTQSDVDVHHLASLDPIMYRNLLYLKSYKGDVTDLGLDFTVLSDELGERRVDELKAGGANIPVTNHNRIEYIHMMADYKLNKQIRGQCYAFKQGIGNVVPLDWLQMFNNKELQVLISGAQIPVDVSDLKLHTNYTGGYTPDHPTIVAFWKVVVEFSDQQKSQLLKFVTSCSRPPLLGFKELDPPFCIQHAGSINRLPTSSTCMNLLKLPEFPDENTLREKLLYAIQAGAGFELS